jgi:hypothetical protein
LLTRQRLSEWAALLLVTAACLPANAAADAAATKDCKLLQYASLYVLRSSNGAVLVPVVIGDQTVRMYLSAESAASSLQQWAVERMGLKVRSLPVGSSVHFGDKHITVAARVPLMSLGNARFKDSDFLVIPGDPPGGKTGPDVPIGILGMDMLSGLDVELDLGHDKVNLFSPDHCPATEVYWAHRFDVVPMRRGPLKDLYIVVTLDGKKVQAKLATGSERSGLEAVVAKGSFGWDKGSAEVRTMSLGAGGLTVLNAPIYLIPSGSCAQTSSVTTDRDGALGFNECAGAYPLRLGTGVLNKLRVYLAAKEEKLYFTAAEPPQEVAAAGTQ